MQQVHVPVVIIGAGIAGLWVLNRLRQKGVQAILLERTGIGGTQTMASQGIIHGGAKYVLSGKLTQAADSVAQMTEVWAQCLQGNGEIDLRAVRALSEHHYLWSLSRLTGGIKSFISAKVLNSNTNVLKAEQYPPLLRAPGFTGSICELQETVLDVPSLVRTLAMPHLNYIWQADASSEYHYDTNGALLSITLRAGDQACALTADHYVLTAGEGNESILSATGKAVPKMQRRPLQMVWLKFPDHRADGSLFLHCITSGMVPRLTITTHTDIAGKTVWYLGGGLAESGTQRSAQQQIQFAKQELAALLPWVNLADVEWGTLMIDRAEQDNGGKRPAYPGVKRLHTMLICWPTKLTLAPAMAKEVLNHLQGVSNLVQRPLPVWPTPVFAKPVWEQR